MNRFATLMVLGLGSLTVVACSGAEDETGELYGELTRACGVRDLTVDEAIAMEAKLDAEAPDDGASFRPGQYEIPVHVHVINKGTGLANGDITDKMIEDQIAVLNNAYAGKDGQGGRDTAFRFKLASVDRTTEPRWYTMGHNTSAEREAKTALRKGGAGELNMYFASPGGGLLGWATFPSDIAQNRKLDGVVILNTSVPGGSAEPYHLGDTATHEVGHWLGLYHTFQGGCVPPGDSITDTPRVATPNFGNPARGTIDSCPTPANEGGPDVKRLDLVQNFMDYTDDLCMDSFTKDQDSRMVRLYKRYRLANDPI
jgi:hypothetical protein